MYAQEMALLLPCLALDCYEFFNAFSWFRFLDSMANSSSLPDRFTRHGTLFSFKSPPIDEGFHVLIRLLLRLAKSAMVTSRCVLKNRCSKKFLHFLP
jgi:hypothetical protein